MFPMPPRRPKFLPVIDPVRCVGWRHDGRPLDPALPAEVMRPARCGLGQHFAGAVGGATQDGRCLLAAGAICRKGMGVYAGPGTRAFITATRMNLNMEVIDSHKEVD